MSRKLYGKEFFSPIVHALLPVKKSHFPPGHRWLNTIFSALSIMPYALNHPPLVTRCLTAHVIHHTAHHTPQVTCHTLYVTFYFTLHVARYFTLHVTRYYRLSVKRYFMLNVTFCYTTRHTLLHYTLHMLLHAIRHTPYTTRCAHTQHRCSL